MNVQNLIGGLMGGLIFLGISVYILVAGHKKIAQKNFVLADRYTDWLGRNLWLNLVAGSLLALAGIFIVIRGISQLMRQDQQGTTNLIGGLVVILISIGPLFLPREMVRAAIKSQKRQAEFLRRHSWILLIIATLTGSIGVTLLVTGVVELLK